MRLVERRVKPQNLHFNPPLPLPPSCDWYNRSRLRTSDPHPLPASAVLEAAPSYRMQQLHFVLLYQLIQDAHHINSSWFKDFKCFICKRFPARPCMKHVDWSPAAASHWLTPLNHHVPQCCPGWGQTAPKEDFHVKKWNWHHGNAEKTTSKPHYN